MEVKNKGQLFGTKKPSKMLSFTQTSSRTILQQLNNFVAVKFSLHHPNSCVYKSVYVLPLVALHTCNKSVSVFFYLSYCLRKISSLGNFPNHNVNYMFTKQGTCSIFVKGSMFGITQQTSTI